MGVLDRVRNPQPRPKAPALSPDVRASQADIRRMSGSSIGEGGQAPVKNSVEGDRRQPGFNSGPATRSRVGPYRGSGGDGPEAA
jgi:hypothetical protein